MSLLRLITFRQQSEPAGPPALWTPAEISTSLWLDASDSSTIILNGSNVSQWNDKSGNSRNATQNTANEQPTYVATAQNNLNVVDFNLKFLRYSPNLSSSVSLSTFVVMKATGLGNTSFPPIITWFNQGGLYHYLAGSNQPWAVYDGAYKNSTELIGNSWKIIENTRNRSGGTLEGFANNTQQFYSTGNAVGSQPVSTTGYGSQIGYDQANQRSRMQIGEIIITETFISIGNRQKIEGYLAHKWGLTASLPGGHPYKTIPPYV